MTEPTLDINVYSQQTIPAALAELMDNHSKMQQISVYCKSAYTGGPDSAQIYEQTQSYAKNALLNVAYHIQTIGTHLTTLTQLQLNEVDKLDLQIKYLTQRVDMIHDASGTNVFRGNESGRPYKSTLKDRKVETESSRAPTKFTRKQVHYGINTTAHHANGVGHSSSTDSLSLNNSMNNNPNNMTPTPSSSQHSTPSIPSPSYTSTPPPVSAKPRAQVGPAPSLHVPPSIPSVRPPSVSSDFPPPPPPSFDLPPPPPFGAHPPPPPPSSFDLPPPPFGAHPPPPPPGMFDLPPPPPPM